MWIPSLNLALEYQGEQHYHNFAYAFGSSNSHTSYTLRDKEKKRKSEESGIKLVEIPYWWDLSLSSLDALCEEQ